MISTSLKLYLNSMLIKRVGLNNVSPYVLKMCAQQITPSLQVFFNLGMRLSQVPNMWKCAYVSPIHNKGDRHKVNDNKPVSLLSIVSKIMERCIYIYNHIHSFVSKNISDKQLVFFSGRSCNTQLLEVYHKIGEFLSKGFQTDVIYLDFTKTVYHTHYLYIS